MFCCETFGTHCVYTQYIHTHYAWKLLGLLLPTNMEFCFQYQGSTYYETNPIIDNNYKFYNQLKKPNYLKAQESNQRQKETKGKSILGEKKWSW